MKENKLLAFRHLLRRGVIYLTCVRRIFLFSESQSSTDPQKRTFLFQALTLTIPSLSLSHSLSLSFSFTSTQVFCPATHKAPPQSFILTLLFLSTRSPLSAGQNADSINGFLTSDCLPLDYPNLQKKLISLTTVMMTQLLDSYCIREHFRSRFMMSIIVDLLFDLLSDTSLLPGIHYLTLPLTMFIPEIV